MIEATDIEGLLFHHRVSQFLFSEARMLDDREWDKWAALFTEEGTYWAPASYEQPDPIEHVSLIYEDQLLRKVRLARFSNPNAFSLQPFPRTCHFISNIMIDSHEGAAVTVSSCFQMTEYRRDKPNQFNGRYVHDLVDMDGSFKINQKKAILVNCDGTQPSSSIYF